MLLRTKRSGYSLGGLNPEDDVLHLKSLDPVPRIVDFERLYRIIFIIYLNLRSKGLNSIQDDELVDVTHESAVISVVWETPRLGAQKRRV